MSRAPRHDSPAAEAGQAQHVDQPADSTPDGESRYRRHPAPGSRWQAAEANRVWRPTFTEPETAPMTQQQYEQAIGVLSTMIVTWVGKRLHQRRSE